MQQVHAGYREPRGQVAGDRLEHRENASRNGVGGSRGVMWPPEGHGDVDVILTKSTPHPPTETNLPAFPRSQLFSNPPKNDSCASYTSSVSPSVLNPCQAVPNTLS